VSHRATPPNRFLKRLFDRPPRLTALGVLADFVVKSRIPTGAASEEFLHEEFGYIESSRIWQGAERGIEVFVAAEIGRDTFWFTPNRGR